LIACQFIGRLFFIRKNIMKKTYGFLILLLISSSVFAGTSATVATIADGLVAQLQPGPNLMAAIAYVSGIVLGIKGVLKLKEHNESKGQVKLIIPIVLLLSAFLLLALPSALKSGIETFGFDQADQKNFTY